MFRIPHKLVQDKVDWYVWREKMKDSHKFFKFVGPINTYVDLKFGLNWWCMRPGNYVIKSKKVMVTFYYKSDPDSDSGSDCEMIEPMD